MVVTVYARHSIKCPHEREATLARSCLLRAARVRAMCAGLVLLGSSTRYCASGNVWSANYGGDSVSLVSNAGTVISSGYTGGGLDQPGGIAVDGSGTVWVDNYHGRSFTELAGAASTAPGAILSPSSGFGTQAGLVEPYGIAIDASGNVWISNFATVPASGQRGTITEFVGLAIPVKTPLVGPAQIP